MRRDMEERVKEREKGKTFHDATVVSTEEVLRFQALRARMQEENNQRILQEMALPPTSFPFYAACAASGGHSATRAALATELPGKITPGWLLGFSALTGSAITGWILLRWRRVRSTRSSGPITRGRV